MARLTIGRLPYWAIAVILAGLTFGVIYFGSRFGLGDYSFVLLVVPIGLAVWYMAEYAGTVAASEPEVAPASAGFPPEESFEDPVVEADLFDSLDDTDQATVTAEVPPSSPP